MTRIGEEEMSKVIGQRVTSRRLGNNNGNMWWDEEKLPCWDWMRAVNLLFSEAIRLSSSFDVPSVCSRTFNSRISSRISSCVDIVSKFQDMTRIHWWSPICQMRKECSKNNYVSCYLKWNSYDQKLTRKQVPSRKLNREKFAKVVIFFRGLIYSHFWKF